MISALKVVLDENGISQNRLAEYLGVSRQTVSRWILRQKPVSENRLLQMEKALKINRKHFIDCKTYYCLLLSEEGKLNLQKIILRQKYQQPTTKINNPEYNNILMGLSEDEKEERKKYLHAYRQKKTKSNIRKIVNGIKTDIQDTIIKNTEELHEDDLDMLEKNISFYDRLLSLRQSKQVRTAEWDSIFRALHMLTSEETDIDADAVTMGIYKVLKDNRIS